ncbi:hypothetical protein GALMADRAFT_207651 [Galerina marginata CBS 339.88]|uniref:Uncharacterized protein n=1 Tax=Galerina marginata (strain CBS 339.88) TaxID=685588 RepID=A0A067TNU3_GALM3|nr:hypothetical protein GALMADRAFT_207651 [Galerina marginata CBS 339.88]
MSLPNPPQRRLSARRGSTAAPDPHGVHAPVNLNPNRSCSSRLTIVRVPAVLTPTPLNLNEPPAAPVLSQRRLHRRIGPSTGGSSPTTERVSFAFSTFGGGNARSSSPDQHHQPSSSPSSSPRLRPSSPHLSASNFGGKPRLTPDQLVDLARQSTVPRPQTTPASDLTSPPGNQSPQLRPQAHTAPATFTPLPDDIYLPFIDRPAEVSALISTPPDVKLFTLLAQIFRNKHASPVAETSVPEQRPVDLPRDPTHWNYQQLVYHLTHIDRDIAPDFIWAIAARKCILSHSELLWERIKGALGVPPELDVEYDFLEDDESSPDTSDISDDEGRAARGHWSDWDAVMDSPIDARRSKRLSVDSSYSGKRVDDHFRAQMDDKLLGLQGGFVQSHTVPVDEPAGGDSTIAPTPHGARSPPEEEGIVFGTFSPPPPSDSNDYLSIEPLLAPVVSPSHSTTGDGLGDIAEGAEEEEAETTNANSTAPVPISTTDQDAAEGFISPSQIQGLRISTSPMPPSGSSFSTTPILSPISPLPPYPSAAWTAGNMSTSGSTTTAGSGQTQTSTQPQPIPSSTSYNPGSGSHSRASSFSSVGPFQRSESTGNLAASWSAMAASAASAGSYAGSVIGSDAGDSSDYISDGDRMPGNPIFPSNFARLAGGPTLRANNPVTRPVHVVRRTRYLSSGSAGSESAAAAATATAIPSGSGKARTYSHGANMLAARAVAVKASNP